MNYLDFLAELHRLLQPAGYLEIGVRWGDSLGLARCPSVGIDPAFRVERELHTEVHLFRTTSDEYFNRAAPLEPLGGRPFDLAFIDGLHLFEFALRDFINAERHSSGRGVVVFDDVLPRSVDEAARGRTTVGWTGDVFRVISVLREHRPDILVVPVSTRPTGLLLLMGIDPSSTVLADHYDEIVARFRQPDPQQVPLELLERTFIQPPRRLLASGLFETLAAAPDGGPELRAELRRIAAEKLGPAYGAVSEPATLTAAGSPPA